ncbi:MAG: EMC3/TMCO1 family protein [Methanomassiliicoccaceae archaeon]|nr:EMC3/TMCO1 family protein [Methanomassiliicoccaceae archaeon]
MMLSLGIVMILFIGEVRNAVGGALNVVFAPVIGFNGEDPVLTLIFAGIIMIGISTVIRTLMTDTMSQARNQSEMKAFNAELRQARIENNLYKIKKLTEQQKVMMSKSMDASMKMMKTMPITMMVVIPMFSWVWYFLDHEAKNLIAIVPWSDTVNLAGSMWFLPTWVLLYMLISIPVGQLLGRLIRWMKFKKRLEEIDGAEIS